MAVTLNASTSTGLVQSADTSGEINIQSNGSTVLGVTSTGASITGTQSVSGNLSFNSGYGSSAVAYGCRSWVNCDGSATPPTIRASGNVSSVTRAATGTWDINFTTSLTDANYAVGFSIQPSVSNDGSDSFAENLAAGSYRLKHFENGVLRNSVNVLSIVVR